jgi:hypothetical protein
VAEKLPRMKLLDQTQRRDLMGQMVETEFKVRGAINRGSTVDPAAVRAINRGSTVDPVPSKRVE